MALLQSSLLSALGRPFDLISLPMFFSLFAASVLNERLAMGIIIISSLAVGLVSHDFLISTLIIGATAVILVNELHARMFTNRTYYAVLATTGIGWISYVCALYAFINVWEFFGAGSEGYRAIPPLPSLAVSGVALWVFISGAYFVTVMLSKRIRSYFIVSERA